MNKKVVIHFGPGKTGSSALQAWCNSNTETLAQHGIYYPAHAVDANGVSSGNVDAIANRDAKGNRTLDEKKLNTLLAEFERSDAQTLLLSSEFFFPMLRNIYEQLPDAVYVGYIRDPLELHESDYNQRVKLHSYFLPFHAPVASFPVVDALARVMDDCKGIDLRLRPYGKGLFIGGSIIADLLSELLSGKEQLELETAQSTKLVNSSYDYATREFKRLLNYFPIEHLELNIHRLLQKRPTQEDCVSVVPEKTQATANEAHVKRLEVFIKNRRMQSLLPLLDALKQRTVKEYKHQDASEQALLSVASWLALQDKTLFDDIALIVDAHRHYYLDNPAFWACFPEQERPSSKKWWRKEKAVVVDTVTESPICTQSITTFKQRAKVAANVHPPHILASIGEFAFENGETRFADKLLSEALIKNPKQLLALRLINAVREQVRDGRD
ncbi:hypothetical protein A1OK_21140 [Enterovibrio norvegicus FF-454]|uniref:Uncharacterized protein n=1 Tax=Enterovibrio norvegicus FF-454 TaxID=1185651 RepID=A0A1E5C9X6_9GAMM|nr:hypothetical protein [Enterovibrio norvegicus]OEE62300.1 hypothetical protein A1OK_21140 [Enterovibrio norvegicus FF-454]